jgi:hypothetical protein
MRGQLPGPAFDPGGWKLWTRLSPHLDALLETAGKVAPAAAGLASLYGAYGLWLYYQVQFNRAEPLMRRALAIDEQSYGPEHPDVGRDLDNLARLLQATNRLGEAEPLMRRHIGILFKFTRATGHPHPHLRTAFDNYFALCEVMSLTGDHIGQSVAQMANDAGFDANSYRALLAAAFE